MRSKTIDIGGFLVAVVLACAMSALTFFSGSSPLLEGELGICLPSPNRWQMLPLVSWLLNICLILGISITLSVMNKTYTFINSPDMLLPAAFLVMAAASPWISGLLTSSTILATVNIVCLVLLFGCFKSRNATQEIFIIATSLSIGSMFQYAFVFMVPVYIVIAIILKCFRFKEFLALLMGLIAPYWIGVGMGILRIDEFSLPTLTNLFDGFTTGRDLLIGLINCGFTVLLSLMISLNCAVKLYAGNSRRRLYNNAINILGLGCVACMICDFNNLPTYLETLYLVAAVQIANLFALWNIRKSDSLIFLLMLIYVGFYCLMQFEII